MVFLRFASGTSFGDGSSVELSMDGTDVVGDTDDDDVERRLSIFVTLSFNLCISSITIGRLLVLVLLASAIAL